MVEIDDGAGERGAANRCRVEMGPSISEQKTALTSGQKEVG